MINLLFHLAQRLLIVSIVRGAPVLLTQFLMRLPVGLLTLSRTVENTVTASTGIEFFIVFRIERFFLSARCTFSSVFRAIVILVERSDPFDRHPARNHY